MAILCLMLAQAMLASCGDGEPVPTTARVILTAN